MAKVHCVLESDQGFFYITEEMSAWTKDEYKAKIFSDESELGEYEEILSDEGVKVNRVPVVICLARTPEEPKEVKRHLEVVQD